MSARPLVVRCGAFGDVVLVTPLIRLLQARYGSAVDVVGSGVWTPPLLSNDPAVAHVQLLASRKTPYPLSPGQWALVRWLRNRGRGPVYLCDTTPKTRALLLRGGVREDDIVDTAPDDARRGDHLELWPDRWLALGMRDPAHAYAARDVDAAAFRLPRLVVDDKARHDLAQWRDGRRLDGPLVLFQPGNKRTHKRGKLLTRDHPKYWPPGRWASVARAVWTDRPDAQVLLCGSPPERTMLEDIRHACDDDPRLHNLADELPIPRLLALIGQAHGMVSVDTGPAHAAAALACPLVVLFGSAPIAKWRPVGPGPIVVLGGERGDDSVVADIGADAVAAAWRGLSSADGAGQADLSMP